MGGEMTYAELERAYQEASKSGNPPTAGAIKGSVILSFRPDLEGSIDPDAVYMVTKGEIRLIEDADV